MPYRQVLNRPRRLNRDGKRKSIKKDWMCNMKGHGRTYIPLIKNYAVEYMLLCTIELIYGKHLCNYQVFGLNALCYVSVLYATYTIYIQLRSVHITNVNKFKVCQAGK